MTLTFLSTICSFPFVLPSPKHKFSVLGYQTISVILPAMAPGPCGFLLLPSEVRICIYNRLLLSPRRCVDPFKTPCGPYVGWPGEVSFTPPGTLSFTTGLHSTILATCKTITFEGSPILYTGNRFDIWFDNVSFFTRMIGSRNANLVKDMSVFMCNLYAIPNDVRWDQAFRYCSNLRRLVLCFEFHIDRDEESPDVQGPYQESVFMLFKRVQKLLKAHSILKLAMSPYDTGQERTHSHFKEVRVSLVATEEDYYSHYSRGVDAINLDLDILLNDLREKTHRPLRRLRNRADRSRVA